MATNRRPIEMAGEQAFSWAKSHFSFENHELLRDAPWARTYRLLDGRQKAYLKLLPEQQASVLPPVAHFAAQFPRHVPKIIACDREQGWLLTADHDSSILTYESPEADQRKLLRTYARLQVEAFRMPDLLAGFDQPDLTTLLPAFLDFLKPVNNASTAAQGQVGAAYYIGRGEARRYYRTLSNRRALLKRHMAPASALPLTVNHGDLRPPNAAIAADGACILCDWDDAFAGPAGMSLHAMFSGCFKPTVLLTEKGEAARAVAGDHRARRMDAYIDVLLTSGYADEPTLRHALPASICAGVLQYLLNFAKFPDDSRSYRKAVERSIRRRLSDLLDLCDLLSSRERLTALEHAEDYEEIGQTRRAQHLLEDYLADHPDDADAHARLARVLRKRRKIEEALATYRNALEFEPANAALRNELGEALLERLDTDEANALFKQAVKLDPELAVAHDNLARTEALDRMRADANEIGAVPTLHYTPDETEAGVLRPEKLALATSLFETYGVLQVNNAFPVDMIKRLHDAFFERYTSYFKKDDHPDALRLGDQRYMLTVDLDAPFNDRNLFASPLVLPIFQRLLGDDCVIGAFTSVISLPGSKNQSLHKDHPALFPTTRWHHRVPSFAIQLIVPLVPLDDTVGTTRVIKGSHQFPSNQAAKMETQDPVVPLGSCLINDYRLSHRGLGNRSDRVRPILTIIYNRPWFRDYVNYAKQPPLRVNDQQIDQMPERQKKLFSWWQEAKRS
jgi:tetratricopeptide (TPR) repeat protein